VGLDDASRKCLEKFVVDQTQANSVAIQLIGRLSGGAIQENYALDVEIHGGEWSGNHTWVLRTDAPSSVQVSMSRAHEFAVLNAAYQSGVTVPQPLWYCEDENVIGTCFYLMQRVNGVADSRALVRADWSNAQRKHFVRRMGRELATIHAIDVSKFNLDFLPSPQPSPAQARINQYRGYLDNLPDPHPVLEWGLRWLEINASTGSDTVFCHCDYRTGNIMVDNVELTGILDWEFAGLSDPLEDIAWYCARCWRFGQNHYQAGGIGQREDFYRAYAERSGRVVDNEQVTYWEVMAAVRWAVIALQQTQRHLSGEQESLELALTGRIVPEMEYDILQMTQPV